MSQSEPWTFPKAYFVTFTCYGTHLPGAESTWVDTRHNQFGTPQHPPNDRLRSFCRERLRNTVYYLDSQPRRRVVREAIVEGCRSHDWDLLALHVRTTHVHNVLTSEKDPERILNSLKGWASRALNDSGLEKRRANRWTEDGSKVYLWREAQVEAAIHYVLYEQGEQMEVYP